MKPLRTAVVGVGHLGKEHARILAGLPDVELVAVADANIEQANAVAARLQTQAFSDYWPLLNLVDAVSIVAPTTWHYPIASEFLRCRIPVFIEKPIAGNLAQAESLAALAEQMGTVLQVGHIERFNPAFERLQQCPMQPKYIVAQRTGPFTGRSTDIGVVLDLMIHDIDLLLQLVAAPVQSVEALGMSIFGGHEDIANARLRFANGCVADLTANRAHPVAARQMHIWAPEGYAHLNFGEKRLTLRQPTKELRQHGLDPARLDPTSRAQLRNDVFHRYFETVELGDPKQDQLTCELRHFVECVRGDATPRVSGADGRDALALAEKILDCIQQHSWEGSFGNARGPSQFPTPLGPLFKAPPQEDAA